MSLHGRWHVRSDLSWRINLGLLLVAVVPVGMLYGEDSPQRDARAEPEAVISKEEAEELWPSAHPLADSVDRVVDDVVADDADCEEARESDVPCFPSIVQVEGETLQDALDRFRRTGLGEMSSGPSARDEERLRRLAQSPNLVEGSFDPVCVGKSLLRLFKGKKNTFWVYKIQDQLGELVVMRDEPLEAGKRLGGIPMAFDLIGKYEGECAALGAYRKALRALRKKQADAQKEGS